MITLQVKNNIIYTIAEDTLNQEDYDKMVPFLKEKIRDKNNIKWYFEMKDFDGWTPAAAWKDVKFDFENKEHLEKVAMVGSKKWEEWLTDFMKPFTGTPIKFFDFKEKEEARAWIES